MKIQILLLLPFVAMLFGSCGGNSAEKNAAQVPKIELKLPFEVDGINAPPGHPLAPDIAGMTDLKAAENLGEFTLEGSRMVLVIGSDANEQSAVHIISIKGGQKVDEMMLCTYYDMEPIGTDVTITAGEIVFRSFSYNEEGDKSFTGTRKVEISDGKFKNI